MPKIKLKLNTMIQSSTILKLVLKNITNMSNYSQNTENLV